MGVRIGIDVGERSLGLAAVDYDDDGWPIAILAAVSHIHDGGMDPDTAKSPRSRLATAGVARRARRLVRNRRRRLRMFDEVLRQSGIPVPDSELTQTHEAWHARAHLSKAMVDDEPRRLALLSLALRHMARHRGWRNPWWSYTRLAQAPSPSPALEKTIDDAVSRFGGDVVGEPRTLGQLVSRVVSTQAAIRPIKGAKAGLVAPVMSDQVKQEDTLAEAKLILSTQGIPDAVAENICQALMHSEKPRIPRERVGRCSLIPDLPRASAATLEFQEFRIRDTVANLRIGSDGELLSAEQHDAVVQFLLGWRETDRPRWRDVAEMLGIPTRQLRQPSIDQDGSGAVPVDRTSIRIEERCKPKSAVGGWWRAANLADRADFVDFATDLSGQQDEQSSSSLAGLLDSASDSAHEDIEKLELESGRTSYSRPALERMLEVMREERCNAHGARTKAFDLPADWAPPGPTFQDAIEHPTVSRISALVHRFLVTATERWGLPEAVVIEHVRGAFMGPTALAELESEIRINTSRRDKVKAELAAQGIHRPSNMDVRRNECIQRQQGQCLYCGATIGLTTSEMDHVVPRAGGGGNRRDNLVAVCRDCNAAKGKLPFAQFAAASGNPAITVDAAIQRVRSWRDPRLSRRQLSVLIRDVQHRLMLTEDDQEFGDRSLESTAYAARQMRARVQSFLTARGGSARDVHAYAGAVTSEARKAGGIDEMLRLRDFTKKSRFDRRHHAIDAAVLTCLRPSIAEILKTRTNLQAENSATKKYPDWREYRGAQPADVSNFEEWKRRAGVLADRLKEKTAEDRIPVVRPLRLTPRIGSLHADTIEPLAHKSVGEEFTADEIRRVINPRIYRLLSDEAGGGGIEEDSSRRDRLDLRYDEVDLFPSNAAYIPVRNGAASIGGSVRYARIYAWPTKHGFAFGMVRMYAGEFGRLGLLAPGVDILSAPLPRESQALRTANQGVVERILAEDARQIGWLALGDEIELDPSNWIEGTGKLADFMRAIPERAWTVTGFFAADKVSLAPTRLAFEGCEESTPEAVRAVLAANRIPLAVNVVLGSPGCTIVRRTVLGTPRWRHDGLPASWSPIEAAESAFSS